VSKISWNELMTTDFDKSVEFYKKTMDWTIRVVPGRGGLRYALIIQNGENEPFAGIMEMPEILLNRQVPSHWISYITVENIQGATANAREAGATVVMEPTAIDRIGTIASLRDTTAAQISYIQYAD